MKMRALLSCLIVAAAVTLPAHALAQSPRAERPARPRVAAAQERRAEQVRRQREENGLFGQGRRALDAARWAEAAELFARLAALT